MYHLILKHVLNYIYRDQVADTLNPVSQTWKKKILRYSVILIWLALGKWQIITFTFWSLASIVFNNENLSFKEQEQELT